MLNINLDGKRALVCGASQGIGQAIAHELADLGANVTILARDVKKLERAVAALKRKAGQNHHLISLDLSNLFKLKQVITADLKAHGPIDILINNSGGPKPGPVTEATIEEFEEAFNAHIKANVILTEAILPGMRKKHYGRIINITSTSVKTPLPNLGVSNTTRWAVAGWAKTLANEVAKFGITVNTILTGSVETERTQSLLKFLAEKNKVDVKVIRKQIESSIPAGYIGTPQEIAQVVAFLATPSASYVNGVAIAVDGGRTPTI